MLPLFSTIEQVVGPAIVQAGIFLLVQSYGPNPVEISANRLKGLVYGILCQMALIESLPIGLASGRMLFRSFLAPPNAFIWPARA